MRPASPYNPPPSEALRTLHIDEALIIIDKPSGLLSVPGLGPEKQICANSIVSDRHGEVFTVHRLDMDTSGVMVFARDKDTHRELSRLFEQRRVAKTYEALIDGHLADETGTIDAAIAKHSRQRPLRHLDPDGQVAITHWTVVAYAAGQTRVVLKPETGRSHQLRLHMASLGHAILGDVFYGDPSRYDRLCLHAKTLGFEHPRSGVFMAFEADTPF